MSAPTAPRKGEKTRQLFLAAGRTVFVRDGYLNAEISEIAHAAAKSSGTFYIYFNNKSDLLDALFAEFQADTDLRFTQQPAAWYASLQPADWRKILLTMRDTYKAHAAMFYALAQAAIVEPHFAEIFRALRQRTVEDFERIIAGRQAAGFAAGIDPPYGARALENMVVNCLYEWLASPAGKCASKREETKAMDSLLGIFDAVLGR